MPGETRLVRGKIEELRARLLNLSLSNKLLSTKHSDRSRAVVRVVNESPNGLFASLSEGAMSFAALPPLEEEPRDERTEAFKRAVDAARLTDEQYKKEMAALEESEREDAGDEAERIERSLKDRVRAALGMKPRPTPETVSLIEHARAHGIDPSYDLPERVASRDKQIQLLLLPEMAERKLSGLLDLTTAHLQETGINTLFAAFGFLEWYEDDASDKKLHAPLILMPLHMTRELKKHIYVYSVSGNGDGPEANITLREKLRKDFSIKLPDLDEDDTPENYWKKVEDAISHQKRWKVRRWASVGIWPFARMALYHDLDPKRWPDESRLVQHPVIEEILIGRERAETECEIYDIDHPAIEEQAPLLITEADSSQHSAVIDAMRGKNLAIKGPPGTGKSQTITNIIAAALSRGERVLFVAEKMAALNVVSSRLAKSDLSPFCLELHSDKVRRADVAKALKERLEYRPAGDPRDLDSKATELRIMRNELNRYAQLMNSSFGQTGMTVHEVFWATQCAQQDAGDLPGRLSRITVANPEALNQLTIDRAKALLEAAEVAYRDAVGERSTFRSHPWRGVTRAPLTHFDATRITDEVGRWREALLAIQGECARCHAELGWAPDETQDAIEAGTSFLDWVARQSKGVRVAMLPALRSPGSREALTKFLEQQAALRKVSARLEEALGTASLPAGEIHALGALAVQSGNAALWPAEVPAAIAACEGSLAALSRCRGLMTRLTAAFGHIEVPVVRELAVMIRGIEQIERVPRAVLAMRMRGLLENDAREVLEKARDEAKTLFSQEADLNTLYNMERRLDPEALDAHVRALRESGFFVRFTGPHRAARKFARELSRTGKKLGASAAADALERIARHLRAMQAFAEDARLAALCGFHFNGVQTDFEQLISACVWLEEIRISFIDPETSVQRIRQVLLQGETATLEAIRLLGQDEQFAHLKETVAQLGAESAVKISEIAGKLQTKLAGLRDIEGRISRLGIQKMQARFAGFDQLAAALEAKDTLEHYLAHATVGPAVFGTSFKGATTDTSGAAETVAFVERVVGEGSGDLAAAVLRADLDRMAPRFAAHAQALEEGCQAAERVIAEVIQAAELDQTVFFDGAEVRHTRLAQLIERCEACLAEAETLSAWSTLADTLKRAREAKLGMIIDALLDESKPLAHLFAAYEFVVYRSMAQHAYQLEDGLLARHKGHEHEGVRKRFKELDKEILALNRRRIAARLARTEIPAGVSRGKKAEWTDRALIENEANKQRAHIPLRDLMKRAGRAVQAMKPCFMMSPLSVAQFLAPGTLEFDIAIIDEASQMRPEEAIGTVVRAKRVVVVGDPMQLPPTNFFQRSVDDPADEELEDEKITNESILDMALQVYQPARDLRWHYRSRHASLIAFSNKEFYSNSLITFPSPHEMHPDFGVHLRKVDGVYHAGTNPLEAEEIVAGAIEHMHRHPDHSLGLVALNQTQRELIHEEIERAIKNDDKAAAFIAEWQETLEPFFVKNLENVQGDERDVIMISTVYGPDRASGQVMQRFGPITQATGHRRLNVLFTRAKEQTIVYTSMTSDQIRADRGVSWGVRALKGYLEYAATGRLEGGTSSERAPDSDFEIWVAEQLRLIGCEAVPQIGVAGYFIDIGVRHPSWPHGFLFGIECDGATYHSGKSARDRDRLRQDVLEGLGWAIYRIWSTDWFSNPAAEVSKLRAYISHHLAQKSATLRTGTAESALRIVR